MTRAARQFGAATAVVGASLGLAAGIVELAAGPHIRGWVGDKIDTTRLGLTTIVLALIALAAALSWLRRQPLSPDLRLVIAAGLLFPGLVCFSTVGALWYLPGTLLLGAGAWILLDLRKNAHTTIEVIAGHWLAGLSAVLALIVIFLGATALGLAGAVGILGGTVILATLAASSRIPKRSRRLLLCLAAVPFAMLTWWSVITPLLALLLLVIGWLAVRERSPASTAAARSRLRRPA